MLVLSLISLHPMFHLVLDVSIDVNRKALLALLKNAVCRFGVSILTVPAKFRCKQNIKRRASESCAELLRINRSPHVFYCAQAYAPALALCCDEAP